MPLPADLSRFYYPTGGYLSCRDCRWESPALPSDAALEAVEAEHAEHCPNPWHGRAVVGIVEQIEGVIVGIASGLRPHHWTNGHRVYVVRLADGSEVVTDAALVRALEVS